MRVLSGIQPSGKLHLGNYFGAIRQHIELQQEHECIYFIADYHALTSLQSPKELKQNIIDVALDYLALGLNPEKTIFFKQSDVPQVTELAWIFSTITPMGLLERCHSYKDKIATGIPASHGLFAYPVLMAADILIYQSNLVPVGKDQKQHIEVTRDIALRFNQTYREIFTLPDELILKEYEVIPGTDGQKMSKSYGNIIGMFEDEKAIRKKVMSIVTDSTPLEAPKQPETVYALYSLFATEDERKEMLRRYQAGGMGYAEAKTALYEKVKAYFQPYREKRQQLAQDITHVEQVLRQGAERARYLAQKTLGKVRKAIGVEI